MNKLMKPSWNKKARVHSHFYLVVCSWKTVLAFNFDVDGTVLGKKFSEKHELIMIMVLKFPRCGFIEKYTKVHDVVTGIEPVLIAKFIVS